MPNKVTRTHNGLMTAMERNTIGKVDKQAKQFAKDMASVPHVRIDWQNEHTAKRLHDVTQMLMAGRTRIEYHA